MQPMSELLSGVPGATRRAGSANLGPALAWTLAAGKDLAAQSRCLGLRDGILRIELATPGPRRQLESIASELCVRLNAILGPGQVRRLEFTLETSSHA